jgi:AraC-like DNA-binding protein
VALLAEEVAKDDPGQSVVLDRLLDLLLVAALRAAYAREDAAVPAWYRAYGDPVVGRVLRLMHNDPGHPWTVAHLAATVGGVARQVGYGSPFTFSTAFKRTYGTSPRAYRDDLMARLAPAGPLTGTGSASG